MTTLPPPYILLSDSDVSFLILRDRGQERAINMNLITSITQHYDRDNKAVIYIQGVSKPFQTDYEVTDIIDALYSSNEIS
jgi:hypothetical protein